ncbi:MAG: DUF2169 domain-containing protein [Polyangiaceae bacterium]
MSVRLGISRDRPLLDKTLHVFGDRATGAPRAVTPFQRMPVVYERAFGGAGVWENPVGTGGPGSRLLPNIVDPRDARRVAGFGPVAPGWAPRRAMLGGVTPEGLSGAVAVVPEGFDFRFFQAAPADQQIERIRGDEWILLDGMSASGARMQSRLPMVMAAARRQAVSGGGAQGAQGAQAVELRADMLVIDADRMVASLIWRGRFAVSSIESLRGVQILVGLEQPGKAVAWPAAGAQGGRRAAEERGAAAGSGRRRRTSRRRLAMWMSRRSWGRWCLLRRGGRELRGAGLWGAGQWGAGQWGAARWGDRARVL